MPQKWDLDKKIRFLELYEQHPCLWDIRSDLYKDRNLKKEAYHKIARAMNIDGFTAADVKVKIRSIRSAYAIKLSKIAESKKFATTEHDIYKPTQSWFAIADRILRPVVPIQDWQLATENEEDDSVEYIESNIVEIEVDDEIPSSPDNLQPAINRSGLKKVRKTEKPIMEEIMDELNLICRIVNESRWELSEFECFGKLIVSELKKLPRSLALESMAYIQSYLIDQRLKIQLMD